MHKQSNVTSGPSMLPLYTCTMCICNGNCDSFTIKDASGEKGIRAVDEKLSLTK